MTGKRLDIDLRTDCKSLVDNTESMSVTVAEKRLMSEIWCLREAIKIKDVQGIKHIPTKFMIADGLTKPKTALKEPIIEAMQGFIRNPKNN